MDRRIILAASVGILTALLAWKLPAWMEGAGSAALPETEAFTLISPARQIADFSLSQSDGTRLIRGELKGHWTMVFIGFTHCPDICPTTLAQLTQVQKQLASIPDPTRPRVLFVSVDPERDSPSLVGDYAHSFHQDTLAATGDLATLEKFTRSLSMTFAKMPVEPGVPADQYSVDHTASFALLNPNGEVAGFATPPMDYAAIARDLSKLAKVK